MRSSRAAACLLVLATLSTGGLSAAPSAAASVQDTVVPALDSVLAEQFARSPAVPGIVARVDAPGLRWERAVGKADRATGTPLSVGNTFRIASVTKTFTAAAALTLVDQRRVTIDAAVARYLPPPYPDLLRRGGYDPDRITVRMLLNHTSGLYDYATDDGYRETALANLQRHWTPVEQIAWSMEHGSPYGAPGALFHYSDTGYVLLARIVESVTGRGQAAAYRRLLRYDRLGLTATWFEALEPAPGTAGTRAHQYYVDAAAHLDLDTYTADPSFDLYGGGLVSSVADLNRFYRALLDGRVLSPAALRTMLTLVPTGNDDAAGMGIFLRRIEGITCWWHNGFWGSAVLYCPQRRLAVAVNVNAFTADRATPSALADAVALATAASKLPCTTAASRRRHLGPHPPRPLPAVGHHPPQPAHHHLRRKRRQPRQPDPHPHRRRRPTPAMHNEPIDHYSVLREIEDLLALPPIGAATTAHRITGHVGQHSQGPW